MSWARPVAQHDSPLQDVPYENEEQSHCHVGNVIQKRVLVGGRTRLFISDRMKADRSDISRYLSGKRTPDFGTRVALAAAALVHPEDLARDPDRTFAHLLADLNRAAEADLLEQAFEQHFKIEVPNEEDTAHILRVIHEGWLAER